MLFTIPGDQGAAPPYMQAIPIGVHPQAPPGLQSAVVWQPPQRPAMHRPHPHTRSSVVEHGKPTKAGMRPGGVAVGLGSGAGGGIVGHWPGGHEPGWQG